MVQSARYAPCRLRTGLPRTSRSWSGYSGPPTISSYCARRAIPGSRSSASPHLALNAGVPKTLVSWTCRNLWSLLFAPSGDGVRRTYCYSVVSCTIFYYYSHLCCPVAALDSAILIRTNELKVVVIAIVKSDSIPILRLHCLALSWPVRRIRMSVLT